MCRANAPNGEACDCEEYDPPEASAPSMCMECGHGKSKHGVPKQQGVNKEQQLDVKKATVLDIFTAQSEKRIQDILPAAARTTTWGTAREDALKGFRPSGETEAKVKKPKKKSSKPVEAKLTSKQTVFSKVVLLTAGVKKDQLRGSSKAPKPVDIEHRAKHGCVATDIAFPLAFQYLEDHGLVTDDGPLWVIVAKEYQTLRVVPKDAGALGKHLDEFKIDKKQGPTGIGLYIALRATIPADVYRSWNNTPAGPDPSSDGENNQDSKLSDDDSESAGESEYNPTKDLGVDNVNDVNLAQVTRYQTRLDLAPSQKKRAAAGEDSSSELEEVFPVKKQRLAGGRSLTTRNASASSSRSAKSEPRKQHAVLTLQTANVQ
ncbi:hypothetical protein C8R46DRAFT_1340726 [Mycena filopes]|nr:hypothetical protein C8R46DRAFT_1351841 [Mycena filopes]KAJ7187770.1 hypothetical protein C8R46DRAFT_1340726 [Mycena filopes]